MNNAQTVKHADRFKNETPPQIEELPIDLRCGYCKKPTKGGQPCAEDLLALAELREER